MRRWAIIGVFAIVGCAAPKKPVDAQWRKTTDTAVPIDQARSACKAYAMERSNSAQNQSLAAKAAAGAFAECMQERGWVLVDQE